MTALLKSIEAELGHRVMSKDSKEKASGTQNSGVTIFDVAKEVGVHASTVSRALDPGQQDRVKEPTRIRILEAVDRLGYRPDLVARGLRRGKTGTIGVIASNLGSTYMTPIIHGLSDVVSNDGMLPLIAESNEDHDQLGVVIDHMLSRRVDALVVAAAHHDDAELLEEAGERVPIVLAARPIEGSSLPHVVHDENFGGRQVAIHLESLGHESAVQLLGPQDAVNLRRRRNGFSKRWAEAGKLEIDPPVESERPSIEEGRRMIHALVDRDSQLPTAIFANHDFLAIGALSALNHLKVDVPTAISLVGYNDLPASEHLAPPLTTVRTKTYDIGVRAGQLVQRLLRGEAVDNVTLKPVLVVRNSTASPPSSPWTTS